MDKQQAQRIVQEVLGAPFDKAAFIKLTKELFNEIDESKAFHARGYVPEAYKKYVKTYERIATYTDPDDLKIDILIVYLQNETTLERARTSQRNFIAHYLKERNQKDAGIIAFISPDPADWRFSLVKMDYKIDEKGKVKEYFTPARRWSFLVGANENSHTARSRLVPLILDDTHNPPLAGLEEAFNIEAVTKEFFTEYRDLFIRVKEALDHIVNADVKIKNNFAQCGVNTVDFAKKLLGQIIFLYFLQKKGWFGVGRDADWGTGSKQFLRELFEESHGSYENFFNDILEPLFYDALRIDRSHDDHYYSRFNCKIPFLNGGLFDPLNNYDWVHTDILISNELFSNNHKTAKGDTGSGILDIFDRYNFTVKEDEPLEKEVAIDPELLGKAYEKFNAIRFDNFAEYQKALKSGKKGEESKFNKQFGVYYTPRDIVHYMCQQSLINYLYTEFNDGMTTYEKLGIKQTDMLGNMGKSGQLDLTIEHKERPAIPKEDIETLIHYGERITETEAIAIAKEENISAGKQKTTKTKSFLSENIRSNAQKIDEKLSSIKVCDPAIGSGAFPVGMMTEIVRTRNVLSNFIKDNDRSPYRFKRECIENSLYGVDVDSGAVEIAKLRLWLSLVVDEDDIKTIKPLPNLDYKIVCGDSLIGFPAQWDSPITKEIEFLKHKFISETNPTKKNELKRQIDGKINDRYKNSLKIFGYTVKFDFYTAFSEVFHEKKGFDVVIGNPPYGLINKRQNKGNSIVVSDEEFKYFKQSKEYLPAIAGMINIYRLFILKSINILRKKGTFIEIFPLSFIADVSASTLRNYILKNYSINFIEAFPERDNENKRVFETVKMSICIMQLEKQNNNNKFYIRINHDKFIDLDNKKVFFDLEMLKLFDKRNLTIPLINQEDVDIIKKIYNQSCPLSERGHCYTGEIDLTLGKKYLNDDTKHATLLKGAIIDKYLIRKEMSQGEIKYLDSTSYLSENKGNKSSHYLQSRIVMQGITGVNEKIRLKMTIAGAGVFCGNSANYFIINNTQHNQNIYLGILNSKLLNYIFTKFSTNSNVNGYEVDNLPFPKLISEKLEQNINSTVNSIFSVTQSPDYIENTAKQTKVNEYEKEIDQMVYALYGLTPEEIAIVEGKATE